ncbi:hypothetical protein H5410_041187 [Solanum commersonii]|uniref:Uncharacterized protein n=1 Tax=Solanum commersonii TaxID=4109 RepID=A0A9J5XR42_SOLCO|nr:hypothetical protein H5410_041187 [Solanum commersonii]
MLLQITYHDKATRGRGEEEDTIEKILKAITTLCTKVDSMDNEIQKLKTNEDNLKSKASRHDYKNASYVDRKAEKSELKGGDGKLLQTHNICLNTIAGTSKRELANNYLSGSAIWSYYARDRVNDLFQFKGAKEADMDEVERWILSLLKREEQPTTRALKVGFI